jgi:hypothetical protein
MTYYKWLKPDRTTIYQGIKWPKRVGVWTPDETPKLCASGWHLATHRGIAQHARTNAVLWIAEGRGVQVAAEDKIAFTSARLVSQVGTLTQPIAVRWAAECAQQVLNHYEDRYPDDKRPREAIDAALRWAKNPTETNAAAANAAANAAGTAYAAGTAANAAADAAGTAYHAYAYAAGTAAYAAAYAAGTAYAKEREWQSNRLLELLRAS